jgi:hypothetical protein
MHHIRTMTKNVTILCKNKGKGKWMREVSLEETGAAIVYTSSSR